MTELLQQCPQRRVAIGEVSLAVRRGGVQSEALPVYLLHGYPQTSAMWHRVAPALAAGHDLVLPDLRGYGASDKPAAGARSEAYSKRAMAADIAALARQLGHPRIVVVGHDRGARVAHRLALDCPDLVAALGVIDIVPTLHMFEHTDQAFATGYYHWFFLAQADGLPERLIGADPDYYLMEKLRRWSAHPDAFDQQALAEYRAAFADPACIAATCHDYRAAAGIDLDHDRASRHQRVACPVVALWGQHGFVERTYDVLTIWRDYATQVTGQALDSGHFVPEEDAPGVVAALQPWLKRMTRQ